jgi:hypothetical protein
MQQRLVVWGDIGTDHKALITIELLESEGKVEFFAFAQEEMTQEVQDQLFTVWKNGGEYEFPKHAYHWEVPSNKENLLPEEITLHKPGILINAHRIWQKKVMLTNNFNLFQEKLNVLHLELDSLKEFSKVLWGKTQSLWEDIANYNKKGLLFKPDIDTLKVRVDALFTGLKAFKRINHEKGFEESNHLLKMFTLRIEECIQKLVYPEEWTNLFNRLKLIQNDVNAANLSFKHKRILYDKLNAVFNDLRTYKQANYLNHNQDRIKGLKSVIAGMERDIELDSEDFEKQCSKMKHYTRGKMTDAEIEAQFKFLKDRIVSKQKKIQDILKTIHGLENKVDAMQTDPIPNSKKRKKVKKKKPKVAEEKTTKVSDSTKAIEAVAVVEVIEEVIEPPSEIINETSSIKVEETILTDLNIEAESTNGLDESELKNGESTD